MKRIICFILLLVLSTSLIACKSDEKIIDVPRDKQFIVGLEANYAPFNYTESQKTVYNYPIANFPGKYADGYDVQIAKAVAASLGKVLVLQKLDWDALIPSLEANKIDAIIAGMSPTETRKQSVLFTDGYYESTHVVLVKKGSKYETAKTLSDFSGAKIVGQHGTVYDDLIDQLIGASHQTPLESVPDILTAILGNKSDGTILEKPVASGIVASNSELAYVELEQGFVVTEEEVVVSIALRKNETALQTDINLILQGIKEEVRLFLMEQAVIRANGQDDES